MGSNAPQARAARPWAYILVAMALLPVIELMLRLAGYRRTQRVLRRLSPSPDPARRAHPARVARLCRAVAIAARRGPCRSGCLRRSLAIWWLLRWRRVESNITIGLDRRSARLPGHAWVSLGGEPVDTPAGQLDAYIPILSNGRSLAPAASPRRP